MPVSRQRFDELVDHIAANLLMMLDPGLRALAAGVMIQTADRPTPEQDPDGEGDLLGLYEGVPLVERGADYTPMLPDRITLFYLPLTELCADEGELIDEIDITLRHEFGHYFGLDEDELDARGFG